MTNLLTLAKLDEDIKLPLAETDISSLIQASLSAYTDIAETRRLKLRCDIQPAIILKTHRDTFMQMISILVDNAFKYTPDGGEIFFCLKSNGGKLNASCPAPDKIRFTVKFQ